MKKGKIAIIAFMVVGLAAVCVALVITMIFPKKAPVYVTINGQEYSVGSVELRRIPKIKDCREGIYGYQKYLYKFYANQASLDKPLHFQSQFGTLRTGNEYGSDIGDDGAVTLNIWKGSCLIMDYTLDTDNEEDSGYLYVTSFNYIEDANIVNNILQYSDSRNYDVIFNGVTKDNKDRILNDTSNAAIQMNEVKFSINENCSADDVVCFEKTTSVSSGNSEIVGEPMYSIIFIKNNILYNVSGENLNLLMGFYNSIV